MSEGEKDEILDGIDGVLKAIENAEDNHKFKKRRVKKLKVKTCDSVDQVEETVPVIKVPVPIPVPVAVNAPVQ